MTYLFTFGFDHLHPRTGKSLARTFIEIPGDIEQSRRIMLHLFRRDWAFQYPDRVAAKTERYNLRSIEDMRVEWGESSSTCECISVIVYRDWRDEEEIIVVTDPKCPIAEFEGTLI